MHRHRFGKVLEWVQHDAGGKRHAIPTLYSPDAARFWLDRACQLTQPRLERSQDSKQNSHSDGKVPKKLADLLQKQYTSLRHDWNHRAGNKPSPFM